MGDIPIPLVTDRHQLKGLNKRYLATFLGSIPTHPIRKEMFEKLKDKDLFWIEDVKTNKAAMPRFVEVTEQSIFTLCPRGYGKTSFRLYEAMQLGSVPVYISDTHWLPFTKFLNWEEFCVIIKADLITSLPEILEKLYSSGKWCVMAARAKQVYDEYFCYESCFKWIAKILEEEAGGND